MNNPVLNDKVFRQSESERASSAVMTVKGTMTKTLLLLLMVAAGAAYTWKVFYESLDPSSVTAYMYGGLFGGFILAMIVSFVPKTAPYLTPFYAAGEGLFLGGISAMFNTAFAETAPNIIFNAVALTLLTAVVMFTIYRKEIIKVTDKFRKVILISLTTILIYYVVCMILRLCGVNLDVLYGGNILSIVISIVIVGVAAFSLLLDFDFITKASQMGAPKYMEWYGAFGLVVTLVWLYLEILKLLSKFANRN